MIYYKITDDKTYVDCMQTLERQGYLWVSGAIPTTHLEYFKLNWGTLYIRVPKSPQDGGISFGLELPEDKTSQPWISVNTKKPSIFRSGIKGN